MRLLIPILTFLLSISFSSGLFAQQTGRTQKKSASVKTVNAKRSDAKKTIAKTSDVKTSSDLREEVHTYNDYEFYWRIVDSLEEKGLSRSALETTENIYQLARKERNIPGIIKSLLVRLSRLKKFRNESLNLMVNEIEKEIAASVPPEKWILQAVYARLLLDYLCSNYYHVSARTGKAKEDGESATWDRITFTEKIASLYISALSGAETLRKTPLLSYGQVLRFMDEKSPQRFPTLYDFIARDAVSFFSGGGFHYDTRKMFSFKDTAVLTDAESFMKIDPLADTSRIYNTFIIKLFQDLLRFHENDTSKAALIQTDLTRLKFFREFSSNKHRDSLYISSLENIYDRYRNDPFLPYIIFDLVEFYDKRLHLNDDELRYNPITINRILDISRRIEESCYEPVLKEYGRNLKEYMLHKELAFSLERENLTDEPFRIYVEYRMVDKIYLKIVPVRYWDHDLSEQFIHESPRLKYFLNKPGLNLSFNLPGSSDMNSHSTEITIPPLSAGAYIIFASPDSTIPDTSYIRPMFITVTRLTALVSYNNKKLRVYTLDRKTGKPLKDVIVRPWFNYFENSENFSRITKSNSKGIAVLKGIDFRPFEYKVTLISDRDTFILSPNINAWYINSINRRFKIFTDRKIYHPGQTVFFKVLAYRGSEEDQEYEVLKDLNLPVILRDHNSQIIDSLKLTTNQFGSVSGSFLLPDNLLNGHWSISVPRFYGYFDVVDYKLPAFEVAFSPVIESYLLGDTVKLHGTAKSLSGSAVAGAEVLYSFSNKVDYPFGSSMYAKRPGPQYFSRDSREGKVRTDALGNFVISFVPYADSTIQAFDPVYTYTISAEIFDPAGELRKAETRVKVSEKMLIPDIKMPDIILNREEKYALSALNINGGKEKAEVTVSIFRLKNPSIVYRERRWEKPEIHLQSEEEYRKLFPFDQYDDENNFLKWEKEAEVFGGKFITSDTSRISFPGIDKWQPGKYMILMKAIDKQGRESETITYFTLAAPEAGQYRMNDALFFYPVKDEVETGETSRIIIGSGLDSAEVYLIASCSQRVIAEEKFSLNREQIIYEIPVDESLRGGFTISCRLAANNRVYSRDIYIRVPRRNTELMISLETFRTVLTPGAREEWRLKIRNFKGKPVRAELLASMYDESIDNLPGYEKSSWDFSPYHPNYYEVKFDWQGDTKTYRHLALMPDYLINHSGYFSNSLMLNTYGLFPGIRLDGGRVFKSRFYSADSKEMPDPYDSRVHIIILRRHATRSFISNSTNSSSPSPSIEGMLLNGPVDSSSYISESSVNLTKEPFGFRKNLKETAFFFPDLKSDKNGDITLTFNSPEALSRWKFQAIAHTEDMEYSLLYRSLITRKELMVKPNPPRYLRQRDTITFSAAVSNLSDKKLKGKTYIRFFDASTREPLDSLFQNLRPEQQFELGKKEAAAFFWKVAVPRAWTGLIAYQVYAQTDEFSDGEENTLQVLPDNIMVTESMPFSLKPMENRSFVMTRLKDLYPSIERNERLTFEYSLNPLWYAIRALPGLMEYQEKCSEKVFNNYYAGSVALFLMNSDPEIKRVFDKWSKQGENTQLSALTRNSELKDINLRQTPWLQSKSYEESNLRSLSKYFNTVKLNSELSKRADELIKLQNIDGSWSWYPMMPDDPYFTSYIVAGFGRLKKMGVDLKREESIFSSISRALNYLNENYYYQVDGLIHYLYARSFFYDNKRILPADSTFGMLKVVKERWLDLGRPLQAMTALISYRTGDTLTAENIMRSLKENAIVNEEDGIYFSRASDYYSETPWITEHVLIMEAFEEIMHDRQTVDLMRTWLLKQKQANSWNSSIATSDAVYALIMSGSRWLNESKEPEVFISGKPLDFDMMEKEEGTGYVKKSWRGDEIKEDMAEVKITNNNNLPAWGALYWQYWQKADKITSSETSLKIKKEILLKKKINEDFRLVAPDSLISIHTGDEVIVRLVIKSSRDMEYIHLKDMRAPGLEPAEISLAGTEYQEGLYYYKTIKDASIDYFIHRLPKGTYVLEYPLRAVYRGNYSYGIATIQSVYAPEFTSHSEGKRIVIE